uniref:Ubiquitin-like domain-containing protein n=1 Tax=Acrobeloides nanus TaxID=290746 RepID=A0A914D2M0_9BILA
MGNKNMKIKFETTTKTLEMELTPTTTVLQAKKALSAIVNQSVENLSLIFSGKHLENHDTLEKHGIREGQVVQLVIANAQSNVAQFDSGEIPAILEAGLISAVNERVGFQYLITREEAKKVIIKEAQFYSGKPVSVVKTVSIENVLKNLYSYYIGEADQNDKSHVVYHLNSLSIDEAKVSYYYKKEASKSLDLAQSSSNNDPAIQLFHGKGIYCAPDPKVALGYRDAFQYKKEASKLYDLAQSSSNNNPDIQLFVNNPMGKTHAYRLAASSTVFQLKQLIEKVEFIETYEQLLFFGGTELVNEQQLIEYDIKNNSTLFLVLQIKGGSEMFTLDPNDFDSAYDYDFTNIKDGTTRHSRGGKRYRRPEGANRYAIKVLGKYQTDENSWLQNSDSADVWPVAYHGTMKESAESIIREGFRLDKCSRFLYGNGIYCTPDPKVAFEYGIAFRYEGSSYKLIIQTRVDPSLYKSVHKKPDAIEEGLGEYWLVPNGEAIRPYGICVYPA